MLLIVLVLFQRKKHLKKLLDMLVMLVSLLFVKLEDTTF